jgi:hypothetical protein
MKIRLDLDQLTVESFAVTGVSRARRGTVHANEATAAGEPTCDWSCDPPMTCGGMTYCQACYPDTANCDPDTEFSRIQSCAYTDCDNCRVTYNEVQSCQLPC